ncbi:hypothetical protein GCM10023339_05200 [Alloalcanivorax gelatiniphagus]
MFSSVVVLLTVWERVTTLGTLESQEAIRGVLADQPFSSLGLSLNGATELVRISCMVAAACACATAILGWYVRKPDRPARLGLTLFAVPVFVTDLTAGGLAGPFVAAGAAMLWMQPGRGWFATGSWTPPPPAPEKEKASARRDAGGPVDPWGRPLPPPQGAPGSPAMPPTMPPPATRPYGEPVPPVAHDQYHPYAQLPPAPASWQQRQLLELRPGAMVAAFVITVVMAGGLLALSLLWLALAGLSPDFLMDVLEQQQPGLVDDGLTLEEVRTTVVAISAAFVVWCLVALVLAGFAMARRAWARRGLIVSAAFSAGACFALVFNTPLVLIPAAAAVATVVCLRRVEVRRWFSLEVR